jgi:hypothetical protein
VLGERLRIGRGEEGQVDLPVRDKLLSRLHATIEQHQDGYRLVDNDSRNGCFVDGERVLKKKLSGGSLIRVGVTLFELSSAPPSDGALREGIGESDDVLLGHSSAFRRMINGVRPYTSGDAHLLIVGESGSGKELLASCIHKQGERSGRYMAVDCAGLSPDAAEAWLFGGPKGAGCLARAKDGSVLLDEVDRLAIGAQEKLAEAMVGGSFHAAHDDEPIASRVHCSSSSVATWSGYRRCASAVPTSRCSLATTSSCSRPNAASIGRPPFSRSWRSTTGPPTCASCAP